MEPDEMKAGEVRRSRRLPYEKPAAVDMGEVATVLGASCRTGTGLNGGNCQTVGNGAANKCDTGNSHTGTCNIGNNPTITCGTGSIN